MKKTLIFLTLAMALSACESITATGEHGSISINDSSYSGSGKSKPKGNAYGHNNPKNPHYKGGSSDNEININF